MFCMNITQGVYYCSERGGNNDGAIARGAADVGAPSARRRTCGCDRRGKRARDRQRTPLAEGAHREKYPEDISESRRSTLRQRRGRRGRHQRRHRHRARQSGASSECGADAARLCAVGSRSTCGGRAVARRPNTEVTSISKT